jgi:putative endonuclease
MPYFVYIIFSQTHQFYYKGVTSDIKKRIEAHNNNLNRSTAAKGPWILVYVAVFNTKQQALAEEKRLKRTNTPYIQWLIKQPSNIIKKFI